MNLIKRFAASIYFIILLFIYNKQSKRVILYYHGIMTSEKDAFEQQIKTVYKYGNIVPLAKLHKKNPKTSETLVAITFDDAFENLLDNALPTLNELNIPATIFVPTGNLEDSPRWDIQNGNPDKKQNVMTEEQIKTLSTNPNIELGSHTVSHPRLTKLSDAELKAELSESKTNLERLIGKPVNSISYPHGDYDARVINIAKDTGYSFGYTIEPKNITETVDLLAIPRYVVLPADSNFKIRLILSGAWEVDYYMRQFKKYVVRILRKK